MNFFDDKRKQRFEETMTMVTDVNEQIAYLRSSVIGKLIEQCAAIFVAHEKEILNGTFDSPLVKHLPTQLDEAYRKCSSTAFAKIYRSQEVLDVELSGYKIILTLLEHLVDAVLTPEKAYSQLLLNKVPGQYEMQSADTFTRIQAVIDYISGMTDVYALDLYRKIYGMSLPAL